MEGPSQGVSRTCFSWVLSLWLVYGCTLILLMWPADSTRADLYYLSSVLVYLSLLVMLGIEPRDLGILIKLSLVCCIPRFSSSFKDSRHTRWHAPWELHFNFISFLKASFVSQWRHILRYLGVEVSVMGRGKRQNTTLPLITSNCFMCFQKSFLPVKLIRNLYEYR